jgi:cell division protein FtsB
MARRASTYYEYIFGYATDVYELLEKGFGHYTKIEFMQLLEQAREENEALKDENERLKAEIATMNINIVASLERDLMHMRSQLDKVIKPKYNTMRTVEQLDP